MQRKYVSAKYCFKTYCNIKFKLKLFSSVMEEPQFKNAGGRFYNHNQLDENDNELVSSVLTVQ